MAAWQEQFAVAWDLIQRDYPGYAPGIAAGLSTIMPLANDVGPGDQRSRPAGVRCGRCCSAC